MDAIGEVRRWLSKESRFIEGTEAFDLALVETLRAVGVPLARFTTGVPSLHPQVDSFSTLWEEGKGITFRTFSLAGDGIERLRNSPMFLVYNEGRTVRYRLEEGPKEGEPEILSEFRDAGLTDYVLVPYRSPMGPTRL